MASEQSENSQSADEGQAVDLSPPANGEARFRKIVDVLDGENRPSFNNFGSDKRAAYRLTALACGGQCKKPEQMPIEGIDLRYYHCHRVEMVAAVGGEVITPIRTVLIDKANNAYGFVSDAMPKELDTLREVFGDGPYEEPMLIKVEKITTRKGFSTYTIAPV